MPDFSVQGLDRPISLEQLRGKVVVLNFWATWCPPCIEEMPSLVRMQQQVKDKGIVVLAISVDVDDGAYRKFLKDHNVDLLTARDGDQKIASMYGTFKFPETYVIDRQGRLRKKFIGPEDWTDLGIVGFLEGL